MNTVHDLYKFMLKGLVHASNCPIYTTTTIEGAMVGSGQREIICRRGLDDAIAFIQDLDRKVL